MYTLDFTIKIVHDGNTGETTLQEDENPYFRILLIKDSSRNDTSNDENMELFDIEKYLIYVIGNTDWIDIRYQNYDTNRNRMQLYFIEMKY